MLKPGRAHHPELRRRLTREARVSYDVRHPGVVTCYGGGLLPDGSPYVVFERLRGISLLSLLGGRGTLGLGETIAVGRKLARVLSAVHAAGYVHRDVKPEHVILSDDRGLLSVRLIDFGICLSRREQMDGAERGQVFGTPGYASPEQIVGEVAVDHRADFFGLGATLFQALTGVAPYRGGNAAVTLHRTLLAAAPKVSWLRSGVPRALDDLLARLLAREREERPQNGRCVERALMAVSDTPLQRAEDGLRQLCLDGFARKRKPEVDHRSPTRALTVAQP
jgi:serine/threonine protein kinase